MANNDERWDRRLASAEEALAITESAAGVRSPNAGPGKHWATGRPGNYGWWPRGDPSMATLTNVRERIHYCIEMTTPEELTLPTEQSFIILQVAVPPKEDIATGDIFYVRCGPDHRAPAFEHPLRPLMDMYRSELLPAAEQYMQIEHQFAVLLDALLETQASLCSRAQEANFSWSLNAITKQIEATEKLEKLHRQMQLQYSSSGRLFDGDGDQKRDAKGRYTHFVPQAHAAVGILVARAILVPPRQTLKVMCKYGSKVTVYLGGLMSRDVT